MMKFRKVEFFRFSRAQLYQRQCYKMSPFQVSQVIFFQHSIYDQRKSNCFQDEGGLEIKRILFSSLMKAPHFPLDYLILTTFTCTCCWSRSTSSNFVKCASQKSGTWSGGIIGSFGRFCPSIAKDGANVIGACAHFCRQIFRYSRGTCKEKRKFFFCLSFSHQRQKLSLSTFE